MKYNPNKIERKWQRYWETKKIYNTKDTVGGKKNYMLLTEFAYPSGNLHIGHWYAFSLPDIQARYLRMKGYNVLYPTGFDAFGLPAENAAIKNGIHPEKWTKKNIAYMTKQLKSMGATFDWSRQVSTIDPDYYKWTQWMFLQFYEKGLAYRASTKVNWCPKDKTVLANEQVIDGKCDRCGSEVAQKEMAQWMFKITQFADELVDGLKDLNWQETAKLGQMNWIGRSEGARIGFPIVLNKDTNFLILHGYTGLPTKNFIPWLKKELEDCGYRVQAPELPNTNKPSEDEQVGYILEKCKIDENTVLIGHSLGGLVAMKVLQKFNQPIAGLILVASAVEPGFRTGKERPFWKTFNWDINYDQIKKLAARRTILSDLKEKNRISYLEFLSEKLDAQLITGIAEDEHFTDAREPIILDNVLPWIEVFTTRPDTLFGVTAVVISPELAEKWMGYGWKMPDEVMNYIKTSLSKRELERQEAKEKTGVNTGMFAVNPVNGEKIPVWVADYVLGHYGTGAVMSVPAHDERDREFSEKFNLPINNASLHDQQEVMNLLKDMGAGKPEKTYRLHDWILSRQRYWGVPIPMINCPTCGYRPVADKELPVKLPPLKNFKPADDGRSPLAKARKWLKVSCPKCGGEAERETDTMDTFVDSSWYFMRYTDPKNKKEFASKKKMNNWLPVPMYVGGAEHTTMHLLYSRFYAKALYKLGYIDFAEPFLGRVNRGIILGPDNQKMSKSKGNIIDPDVEVKKYGADAVRMFLAFMGPYEQGGPWSPGGMSGVYRFLNRVWNYVGRYDAHIRPNPKARGILNRFIKEIGKDIEGMSFNTGVSDLMKLLNELESHQISKQEYEIFLKLLAPFAPHLAEELWITVLKNKKSIHLEKWPEYDEKLLAQEKIKLVVQVNGRMRDTLEVLRGLSETEARKLAMASESVKKHIVGDIKKVIYVQDRIINLVI